jgi:GH25 family lysozyme M1 (1,4-beta-N-acetylmuramidase)
VRGIDVSKWQGVIDWNQVANDGVEFAIIRSGWGKKSDTQIDKKFKENINNAHQNGIFCGTYHYSYADSEKDAHEEAKFCLENIAGEKLEFPVVFDIEDREMLALSVNARTQIAAAFCEEIEKAGYYAMIYCNLDWYRNYLKGEELASKYDIWLAQWSTDKPGVPCGIWQYTDVGKIAGIQENVDLNIAYKNYPQIMKERGLNKISGSEDVPENQNFIYYTVKSGDTLWDISKRFLGEGAEYRQITTLNNLENNIIYPGQIIKIPKI